MYYHYQKDGQGIKRIPGRTPNSITVVVAGCRDGLYLVLLARRYAKAVPFSFGENLLELIANNAFLHLRIQSVCVQAFTGSASDVADQVASFIFSQE